MALEERERVIYQKNTLLDVTCQFRFPTILKISSENPVEFQEKIRFDFPLFNLQESPGLPLEISQMMPNIKIGSSIGKSYIFTSADGVSQLNLNSETITFTTTGYERYEHFKQTFLNVLSEFENIYRPAFYSRVGLRYRNLIVPSSLNLNNVDWTELIPPHIAPELHTTELGTVEHCMKQVRIKLEEGNINLNHGLVTVNDKGKQINNEVSYLIDADFYKEGRITSNDVWNVTDKFNRFARNLFRWSITEKLHESMEPCPAE